MQAVARPVPPGHRERLWQGLWSAGKKGVDCRSPVSFLSERQVWERRRKRRVLNGRKNLMKQSAFSTALALVLVSVALSTQAAEDKRKPNPSSPTPPPSSRSCSQEPRLRLHQALQQGPELRRERPDGGDLLRHRRQGIHLHAAERIHQGPRPQLADDPLRQARCDPRLAQGQGRSRKSPPPAGAFLRRRERPAARRGLGAGELAQGFWPAPARN